MAAVRLCPISSCNSRAIRCRSPSWAARAWALLTPRSCSSRSSISLNRPITCATSRSAGMDSRSPGRSRSTRSISADSLIDGRNVARTRIAFTATMTAPPIARTATSVSRTGSDTVTGESIITSAPTTTTAALNSSSRRYREVGGRRAAPLPQRAL